MSERVLLVLGNSISLTPVEAAPGAPVLAYPELLHERLRDKGWRVEKRITSGATVEDIERTARSTLSLLRPDAIVIQLGIVDCAPRPLRESEREFVGRIRPSRLRDLIVWFLHRYRAQLIEYRGLIQRMPIEPFRQHFRSLLAESLRATEHIAVLPVFPANASNLARNPRVAAEIAKYNDVMRLEPHTTMPEAADLFHGVSIEDVSIIPESVHLNQRGHEFIARYLEIWLSTVAGRAATKS